MSPKNATEEKKKNKIKLVIKLSYPQKVKKKDR